MIRKFHGVAFAALALAAAGAFADSSSVKLYGYVDAGLTNGQYAHPSGSGHNISTVTSGNVMTSFFGLAGTDDLGGGLTAGFALESFLDVSTGSTVQNDIGGFWGRTSNVYLSGGFGSVALGQYDNPLFTFGYTYNPFGSSMPFSPTMRAYYYGQSGISGAGVGFDTGWVKSVTYTSPTMGGFTGVAQYAFKSSNAPGDKNSYALMGTYAAGPLSVSAVYESAGVSSTLASPGPFPPAGSLTYPDKEKVWALGGSYDFTIVKAFLQYTQIKDDTNLNKDKIFQVGVSVPVTPASNVLVSYGQLKDKPTAAGSSSAKDKILSLGYNYSLSKRTSLFAMYAHDSQAGTLNDKAGNVITVGMGTNF